MVSSFSVNGVRLVTGSRVLVSSCSSTSWLLRTPGEGIICLNLLPPLETSLFFGSSATANGCLIYVEALAPLPGLILSNKLNGVYCSTSVAAAGGRRLHESFDAIACCLASFCRIMENRN